MKYYYITYVNQVASGVYNSIYNGVIRQHPIEWGKGNPRWPILFWKELTKAEAKLAMKLDVVIDEVEL